MARLLLSPNWTKFIQVIVMLQSRDYWLSLLTESYFNCQRAPKLWFLYALRLWRSFFAPYSPTEWLIRLLLNDPSPIIMLYQPFSPLEMVASFKASRESSNTSFRPAFMLALPRNIFISITVPVPRSRHYKAFYFNLSYYSRSSPPRTYPPSHYRCYSSGLRHIFIIITSQSYTIWLESPIGDTESWEMYAKRPA